MKKYDVVVLTDSRYVNPLKTNTYISNVLREDKLVINALKEKNLSVVKKDWNDSIFDWEIIAFISSLHGQISDHDLCDGFVRQ